jgi:hypothetical protein
MGRISASDSRPSGSWFSGLHTKLCPGLCSILVALCLGGSLSVAADAQTPSPPTASTQFDGTYAFVSSVNVNETYMSKYEMVRTFRCPDLRTGPISIVNGRARRYSLAGAVLAEGTVGPQGELLVHYQTPGPGPGVETILTARIDKDGTIRARQTAQNCNYDMVWRK